MSARSWMFLFVFLLAVGSALPAVAGSTSLRAFEERVRADEIEGAVEDATRALKEAPTDLDLARALQDVFRRERRDEDAAAVSSLVATALAPYLRARLLPPEQAVVAFDALGKDEAWRPWIGLDRARALAASRKARLAERAARDHVKCNPTSAEGWTLVGRLELAKGSHNAAARSLGKALELDPSRPEAIALLAEALWDPRKPRRSGGVLDQALARYPKSPILRLARVDDFLRRQDPASASLLIESLAEAHPKDPEVLGRLALVMRRVGRLKDAETAAKTLLELEPDNARALETLGFVLERAGKLEEALDRYLEAVKVAPDWPDALVSAAFVQLLLGSPDYAERTLDRAFALDNSNAGAHRVQGLLEFMRGKNKDAKKHLAKALKAMPDDVAANRAMGYVLLEDGRAKDAIACFEKVLSVDRNDAPSYRMMGRALLESGKVAQALEAVERALALDEADPWIHFDLGKVFEAKEDFDSAKEAYEKAIELDKEFPWPHIYLAELLDDVEGDPIAALPHYERFLKLGGPDPGDEIAQRVSVIKNQ